MPESVHILLSEAGEHEAGATEYDERIVHGARAAKQAFAEMERACQDFIDRQVEIIEANDALRAYNESTYGDVGGGYFYRAAWFVFPEPRARMDRIEDVIAHFMCEDDLPDEKLASFLSRQEGYDTDEDATYELVMRFCG